MARHALGTALAARVQANFETKAGRTESAADHLARAVGYDVAFIRQPRKRKPAVNREASVAEVKLIIDAEDWSSLRVVHLVACYTWCHRAVYGVDPADLAGDAWRGACSAASKLCRDHFEGDMHEALEFVRWTWAREASVEQWRRDNGKDGGRVDWRRQFVWRDLLTKYLVTLQRMELR